MHVYSTTIQTVSYMQTHWHSPLHDKRHLQHLYHPLAILVQPCRRIVPGLVGMVAQRELPEGLFDLLVRGSKIHTKLLIERGLTGAFVLAAEWLQVLLPLKSNCLNLKPIAYENKQ